MRALTIRQPWAWAVIHAGKTPMAAHDAMEKHYHERHQEDIRRIVGWALAKTEYRRRLASKVTEVQP